MRIAVLSGGDGWHVRDLRRAADHLGHSVEVLDFRRVAAAVGQPGESLIRFDAVVVRTMPPGSLEQVVFRMDLLHRAADRGTLVLNPPRSLEICIDKFLATHRLETAGLPVPPTVCCQLATDAMEAFERLGDVVVKPLFGSEGRGMVRVNDPEMAWRCFRAIERTDGVIYLQQFIHHPGWDLRVFVLDGKPLTAMRRHANNDWRTNVAQGGRTEAVIPSDAECELAVRAAKACGTIAAGVDLLPGPDGDYFVIEVNAVPGWRSLAPTTGVDVATELIRSLARRVESPL